MCVRKNTQPHRPLLFLPQQINDELDVYYFDLQSLHVKCINGR